MHETLGRGYARIEAIRAARGDPPIVPPSEDTNGPPDGSGVVYPLLFIAGAAFLLPYNSFIMAVDYFHFHYPDSTIMFDIPMVYITCACIAAVANNLLVDVFTHNTRINFGILVALLTMLFVAICNIGWDGFSPRVSYIVHLVAVGSVAFGSTIQQASYYGLTGNLPPRYTQAVMVGESAAGMMVALDRISTKSTIDEPRQATIAFFAVSIFVILIHSTTHNHLMRHPLVLYHLKVTEDMKKSRRIALQVNRSEDITLMHESEGTETNYGVLKLQSPTSAEPVIKEGKAFSFTNPVYEQTTSGALPSSPPLVTESLGSSQHLTSQASYKVEDVMFEPKDWPSSWKDIKRSLALRWKVGRSIYPYMVSIGLVYFTTLSLYPGMISEIQSCRLEDWMPITLMTSFNVFDFIGKIMSGWRYEWSRSQLLMASGVRLLIVPLLLMCAAPRHFPHINGDVYPIIFSMILGCTNGFFGSVPMIAAPSRVSRDHREMAGNLMTLSYNGGLLSGALVSYLLLGILGPRTDLLCRKHPTVHLHTTTTVSTTIAGNLSHIISIPAMH